MERGDDLWRRTHDHADIFLRRFGDAWTRRHRDDLVQETTITAWQWAHGLRDQRSFWSAIRTIARRVRHRALVSAFRERLHCGADARCDEPASGPPQERYFSIAGRRVPAHRLLPWVQQSLDGLPSLDRRLLLDFHEGFCCAELSARSNCSEPSVKTRLHRARRRVQREVEERVRAASSIDSW